MTWLTEEQIRERLSNVTPDIRVTHNGRWIDQKCAPDVLCIVSDCIENYVSRTGAEFFSSVDIWRDEYAMLNVRRIFSKPELDLTTSRNEYDKFFQQPMESLAAAKILIKEKRGSRNYYKIGDSELLSYIAIRERNALTFLQVYISLVLGSSGLLDDFELFFKLQTAEAYFDLKRKFEDFTIEHTPINGRTECRRIFTKVINPLAFKYHSRGTEKGRISRRPITYDMLMYNRDNFRDIYSEKPKDMTRSEYEAKIKFRPNANYTRYMSVKAKRFLREYNDAYRGGFSEVSAGGESKDPAIHMHHIFPEARYPEIAAYLENLIALTPTQHLAYAHPMGNTQAIDAEFQRVCLLAKSHSIEKNLNGVESLVIYEFSRFLFVLDTGFSTDEFSKIENGDFAGIIRKINLKYAAI